MLACKNEIQTCNDLAMVRLRVIRFIQSKVYADKADNTLLRGA